MHRYMGATGSVGRLVVQSVALKSNMLGDQSARAVDVYVPPGCDGEGMLLLVDLVGFTSSGLSNTNWTAFREMYRSASTGVSGNSTWDEMDRPNYRENCA